jgi:hypothetical protein
MLSEDIIKRRGKTIPTRTPFSMEIKRSIYMLIFTLLAIIVLVSIVYLLNSSQSTQKGYSLKQQQLEKDTLVEQSHDLVRKIIQAQSFSNIENNALVKAMIKPETPVYLLEEPPK